MARYVIAGSIISLLLLMNTAFAVQPRQQSDKNPHYETPQLVVGILVDQMRQDYIYRFWYKYGDDGLKRLVNEGFSFTNHHYDYMPTITGPGHASVYTGTTPAVHGIIGNTWYVRDEQYITYVTADPSRQTVGSQSSEGEMSPRWMLSSSIADELRLHTNMKAKVVGMSLKDRGAILPAGHTGDAYWLDSATGNFITSTWYYDELPGWVQQFNARNLAEEYVSRPWETLLPIEEYTESIEDNNPYEGAFRGQRQPAFPHDLPAVRQVTNPGIVASTPFGNTLLTEFALAAMEEEGLGQNEHGVSDMLAISYSSTDYIGHQFGPASKEVQDVYLRLDREIARLLTYLDEKFGKENVLIFLTADHGGGHVPNYLLDMGLPAGLKNIGETVEVLNEFFEDEYGENLLEAYSNQQIFLDHEKMKELELDVRSVQERVASFVLGQEGIAGAATAYSLQHHEFTDAIRARVQRGYNAKRSGDVIMWLKPQWMEWGQTGTTHGSPFSYDTRAPMVWYGWDVPAGSSARRVNISDIASTVATFLNTPYPSGNIGNPMNEWIK